MALAWCRQQYRRRCKQQCKPQGRGVLSAGIPLVFAVILLCSSALTQAKTLTVVAGAWGDFTKPDGTGLYFDVLRAALAQSDIELNIRVTN